MSKLKTILLFLSIFIFTQISAQYRTQKIAPISKRATINFSELKDEFSPNLLSLEAPSPSGTSYRSFLERQKKEVAKRYPRKEIQQVDRRSEAEQPLILNEFSANSGGVPLDNHIAVSNDGRIVSVVNNNIGIYQKTGIRLLTRTLFGFSRTANPKSNFQFDPRVMYDPSEDKFIICMISGFECANSEIIFAFSETNDPMGDWHLYVVDGCPDDNNIFADYPMMALTEKELIFTINEVKENVSWQAGFEKTLIYQFDKASGFSGSDLKTRVWSDVSFEGQNIRNVCPIKAADQLTGDYCYLMSNRNFDVENDTFFVLKLTDVQDAPDVDLEIEAITSERVYGLAPNGLQAVGLLQTNDSRVLDGFVLDDRIQFVMNCIDTASGRPAIYHGLVNDLNLNKTITGTVLTNGQDDLGYPGIAYTGKFEGDEDAIIVFSHTAQSRNPGWSSVYYNGEYSDILTVKEGDNYLDVLEGNLERWGDYVGIQRRYNAPGRVWVASTFGTNSNRYQTWIAELGRPDLDLTFVKSYEETPSMNIFPNPTSDRVTVEFELKEAKVFQLQLLDINGKVLQIFYDERPKKTGRQQFSFTTASLAGGVYFLQAAYDESLIYSKRLIVSK